MSHAFSRTLSEHLDLFHRLECVQDDVASAAVILIDSLRSGQTVFLCGNGGSAADSQHIAAELTGRFKCERRPLAGIALTTDTSALTAIGNDYGFNEVFARQLAGLARPGDCLIAISTSGNSQNVIRAAETAQEIGVKSIGLMGKNGGILKELCEVSIIVPSEVTARIQEAHIFIAHSLCEAIDEAFAKGGTI